MIGAVCKAPFATLLVYMSVVIENKPLLICPNGVEMRCSCFDNQMKQLLKTIWLAALLFATAFSGRGQGFLNLNFENVTISTNHFPGGDTFDAIVTGWTAYISGAAQTKLAFNAISLGGATISIHDTNSVYLASPPPQIQGKYLVLLQSASSTFSLGPQTAGIGQTGQIPAWALTMSFWGYFDGSLTFNNQSLSYIQTGSTANYNIYTADISAFSGQTSELLFTALFQRTARIDNIQFSSTAVPEPSTLALFGFGVVMLGVRRLFSGA